MNPGDRLARLGFEPVINACGIYTDLGGSRLSPVVWAAMTAANERFVRLADLLESSGRVLAAGTGAEAARVTPGAAASIALMVAGAMTGSDGAAGERLPNTDGIRNEILLQHHHRYKYDRQIRMTGATLTVVGGDAGTSRLDLERAIGPRTAALFLPGHLEGSAGTVGLVELVELARHHRIPLLVDAAYLCWPLENLTRFTRAGADLVGFSAKYFGGPNAGGFVTGTRAMIDAVMTNNFLRYESGRFRTYGRPFKLDRQTVVGVTAAFEEWIALDHGRRLARDAALVDALVGALEGVSGIRLLRRYFTMDERLEADPVNALVIELEPGMPPADDVAGRLAAGSPSIACIPEASRLILCVDVLGEDEVEPLGRRLRDELVAH